MPRWGAIYAKVREPHPTAVDVLLAGLLAAVGVATELVELPETEVYRDGTAVSALLALAGTVPLVWRRRHPAAVVAVVGAVVVVHGAQLYPGMGPWLGLVAALYAVAAYGTPRAARVSLAVVVAAHPLAVTLSDDPAFDSWGDVAVAVIIYTAVWVFGDSRRMRQLHLEMVEERAARAERERDERAAQAVRDERTRIAREMHDVVAHSVSVMVVQAGAARRMVTRDPAAAMVAAGEVEDTGRAALRDMRRVIGVLRADDEGGSDVVRPTPALEPQPGLDDIGALVATCRDAGLDVRVRVDGDVRSLPSGVELTAYRVVQEALTNTMKHAGPARAEVRIAYHDDALTVVVADDGRGVAFDAPTGGHGLAGMHERVAVYGGELEAGPHPGGGFRVRARLPVDRAAVPAGRAP